MTGAIRLFMLCEAATFVAASLIHSGFLIGGYEHQQARIGEGVIAVVLITGLVVTWLRPAWTRGVGLAAQGFALLGTLVGIFTIAVGVGPRTVPNIAFHVAIVVGLVSGLIVAARAQRAQAGSGGQTGVTGSRGPAGAS